MGSTVLLGVADAVGLRVGGVVVPGFFDGAVVAVAFGWVVPGFAVVVLPGRCEGSTRDATCSASSDFAAVVALFSLAMTGRRP